MPLINNYNKNKEPVKRFQKKPYRPWDEDLLVSDHETITNNNTSEYLTSNNQIKTPHNYEAQSSETTDIQPSSIVKDNFSSFDFKKELRNLFGAQKIIIQYLLKQIEDDNNIYLITKAISMEEFTLVCKLSPNTIKGTLQTLKAKKLLQTYENKHGRGGYARYKFSKEVYTFFSNNLIS